MTSNYLKRIELFDSTHMMSMIDLIVTSVETIRIDSGCSLKKEFTEIIRGFSTIDLYLSEGGYVAKSYSSDHVLISTVDEEEL